MDNQQNQQEHNGNANDNSLSFISIPVRDKINDDTENSSSYMLTSNGTPLSSSSSSQHTWMKGSSRAHDFLTSKGLGWLLEVDETSEEENELSILEELDVHPEEIFYKVKCVLLPFKMNRSIILSSPDFWGPLFVVLSYAFLLLWGQLSVFSWILTIWVVGSFLVFLLTRVLGGDVTYGQSLSVIGYSLLPLILTLLPLLLLHESWFTILMKIIGTIWASFSAGSLLILTMNDKPRQKQIMMTYPILLLYIYFISLF